MAAIMEVDEDGGFQFLQYEAATREPGWNAPITARNPDYFL